MEVDEGLAVVVDRERARGGLAVAALHRDVVRPGIERAEGRTLYDTNGRAYLDAASSMWCAALGHNHPGINAAITDQLGRVAHCTSLGMGADVAVRLA